jgi:hypothetical protein
MADNGTAETDGSYRAHSQAACALDQPEGCFLRRWRRTSRPPPCLHQHRQARDLALRLLRRAIRMLSSHSRYRLILTTSRQTRTTASTSRAFPPHPTLSTLPVTLLPFLRPTSTLSTQTLAPLSPSSLTLADLLSRDRFCHNVL